MTRSGAFGNLLLLVRSETELPGMSRNSRTVRVSRPAGTNRKFAASVRSPVIATVMGLLPPVASPLHETNAKPEAGLAVTVTTVPLAYLPSASGAGLKPIQPPSAGIAEAESAYRSVGGLLLALLEGRNTNVVAVGGLP